MECKQSIDENAEMWNKYLTMNLVDYIQNKVNRATFPMHFSI